MKERVRKRKKFPGTLLFTCATGFMTGWDQAVNADDLMLCLANIHTMEEIDEKRATEALERAKEAMRQKQSIQEFHMSQANISRAMARLAARRHMRGGV